GLAQRAAARHDAVARAGASLVDRGSRIAHVYRDLVQRHVELVGHDLGERGADAHARLNLAHPGDDRAVSQYGQPRIELLLVDLVGPGPRFIVSGRAVRDGLRFGRRP